jgi:hypothetical protein
MAEPIDNRVFVLILQHPQERRELLSTAPLIGETLARSKLAVGLSWPGLARALGEPTEPRHWSVLHLGAAPAEPPAERRELSVLDRHGERLTEPGAILAALQGIVLLDGTWSQAKTLWWRNPWLLKLRRIVLDPQHRSRYGRLRREPRREALSTLEAAALLLKHLEDDAGVEAGLLAALDRLIVDAGPARPHRRASS